MKPHERRQFERVQFHGDLGQAVRILGARIVWHNQETSDVFDLSYKGFRVARPALVSLTQDAIHSVHVELGEIPPFLAPVRVAWLSEKNVGLELGQISAQAHHRLSEYLSPTLIGQNLRRVETHLISSNETFQYWFQGPNATSLFIWCDADDPARVVRVVLELDEHVWEFENRRVVKGETHNARVLQILGQLDLSEVRLRDVIEKVASQA